MDILTFFIPEDKFDYRCFDELKHLILTNESFKNIIIEGYRDGKITGFDEDLWEKIRNQNIRRIPNFEDVFKDGANIGYCTVASKQLSYSLDICYLCGGILPILKGSRNCPDGNHTWIVSDHMIIDTTLMLMIDSDYASKIGYIEQNRYNPNTDPIYLAAKEFTLDQNLKKK